MKKLTFIILLLIANFAYGVDATRLAANQYKFGDWEVIEFALSKGLIYRISTTSLVSKKEFLTFDFLPNGNCQPDPAIMVKEFKGYVSGLDGGMLPYEYKLPNQESSIESINVTMQQGDKFAFFAFKKLLAQRLLDAPVDGRLVMWIPASGDGSVQRSANIYFSLNGLRGAFNQARRLCQDNR